jgi:hypothetical protein
VAAPGYSDFELTLTQFKSGFNAPAQPRELFMTDKLHLRTFRKPLSEGIDHHLNLYALAALAALAAGVSLLASANSAEAEVVVTKANLTVSGLNPVSIDLNKDGAKDFEFSEGAGGYDHSFYTTLFVTPLTGGKVVGGGRGLLGPYASALVKSAKIGPSAHFSSSVVRGQINVERSSGTVSGSSFYRLYGQWNNLGPNRFLGVKFLIKGVTHYGWIRLTVDIRDRNAVAVITEYAYETVPNQKIGAGATTDSSSQPEATQAGAALSRPAGPSLGMLALGADGVSLWRREEDPLPFLHQN